jgi:hypothetical protein
MLVQLPSTDSSMMKVVRSTIMSAIPSMPIVKRMPHDGIQAKSTTDCHAVVAGSKLHHRPTETTNSMAKKSSASMRGVEATPLATSSPGGRSRLTPCPQIAAAPSSGIRRSAGSTQCWYPMDVNSAFMY